MEHTAQRPHVMFILLLCLLAHALLLYALGIVKISPIDLMFRPDPLAVQPKAESEAEILQEETVPAQEDHTDWVAMASPGAPIIFQEEAEQNEVRSEQVNPQLPSIAAISPVKPAIDQESPTQATQDKAAVQDTEQKIENPANQSGTHAQPSSTSSTTEQLVQPTSNSPDQLSHQIRSTEAEIDRLPTELEDGSVWLEQTYRSKAPPRETCATVDQSRETSPPELSSVDHHPGGSEINEQAQNLIHTKQLVSELSYEPQRRIEHPQKSNLPFSFSQLAQGFIQYSQHHTYIPVTSNKQGMASPEQIRQMKYFQRVLLELVNTYHCVSHTVGHAHQTQRAAISFAINRDGSLHSKHIITSTGSRDLDRFFLALIDDASLSFPPVPHGLPVPFALPTLTFDHHRAFQNAGIWRLLVDN